MRSGLIKRFWLAAFVAGLLCLAGWGILHLVPLPQSLMHPPKAGPVFTDRNGQPLRELLVEKARFVQNVPLDEIPPLFVNATIAAEDKRFWSHHGIDPLAVLRAGAGWLMHRRVVSGASTITQQLVKMTGPRRHRSLAVKLEEAVKAVRLEQCRDKRWILDAYLNRLDYGNLRIGCSTAARYYFGKSLSDLSLAESAFLAGLPQAPAHLNPWSHYQNAKMRQERVLERMLSARLITGPEYSRALAERLVLNPPQRVFQAPHFMDLLLQQNAVAGSTSGEIRTTVDLEITRAVEQLLMARIVRLKSQHVNNGAVVVIDNRTGDVLALVGSENYFAPGSGEVNGAWARRSPGSALKPFTYLLAFEQGASPASLVADLPAEFQTPTGSYSPENYNRRCYGPMRYRLSLANSLNISAVKVLNSIGGCEPLLKRLRACGLTTLDKPAVHYGLGLTIGNAEVRLLELANAYACLARLGEYKPWRLLPDRSECPVVSKAQVCDRLAAYLIADILSDSFARSLAFGMNSSLRFDFRVGCKTGTSTDFRDNWAMGFTPEFTVGVWVGNFDGRPMEHVSGVTGAGPVLHDVFEFLHDRYGTTWYEQPAEIIERAIHPVTGKLLANPGPDSLTEKFVPGTLPPEESPDDYDAEGRVRLGSEYASWFDSGANWLAGRAVIDESRTAGRLHIVSPLPGSTCVLDPDLPSSGRLLPLMTSGSHEVVWKSNTLEIRNEPGKVNAILREGRHELTASDPVTGETAKTWIQVKAL